MYSESPMALIIGIEHFVARKLAAEVVAKDIGVVGVGEYTAGLNELKNFTYKTSLEDLGQEFNYVFDFSCRPELWTEDVKNSEKITLVSVGNTLLAKEARKRLKNLAVNWRVVEALGVYGPGMVDDEESQDVGFLVSAIRQAVANKNLTMPTLDTSFRILAVDDLVEAVLRASFLSATEEETFWVMGNKINSEVIAKVLINEAKMTRFKVVQKEMEIESFEEDKINDSQRRLRWQPKIEFEEGIKETLQYFFSKIDEENRKKPVVVETKIEVAKPIVKEKKKHLEVVIEETEEKIEIEKTPEIPVKKQVVETVEEEMDEIENIVVKNSNLRPSRIEETEEEVEEVVEVVKKPELPKLSSRTKSNISWMLLILVVVGLISVPISWVEMSVMAYQSIGRTENLIKAQKYDEAERLAIKNYQRIKGIDEKIDDWGLNRISGMRNYQTLLKVAEDVLDLEYKSIGLAKSGEVINNAVFKEKQIEWDKQINLVSRNLDEVNSELGVLQARLSGDWSWLPGRWRSSLQKRIVEMNKIKSNLELASRAIKILPEFLGLDGKRREYLVLMQNETELRPGGGFIGSYGILGFEGGRLSNFDIKDIYEADGQLNGHVEPPEEIKNYLGEGGWFMRDANWKSSFPEAATDLQWFLEKETGRKVDGVIGVNLAVAKSVLGAVGEVYVPDFKEKINKDNLYEQAEFYAETKFFPGSNQKASFLGGLGKQLFEDIKSLKNDQRLNLLESILESLEKNDIQVAVNQKESAQTLASLGWDGAIYQGKCGVDQCAADYLYLVEANLGVNKANYFLYRNIEQTIDISNRSLSRVVKINYENTAKNSNWPGGDYKNYLRIYLPKDVNLSEVSLVDGDNPNSKKVYSTDELKIKEVDGKKEIGFLVNVPVSKKRIVEIRYSTEIDMGSKNKFSYVNYIQKQSGFGDTGLVTLVSYPPEWQPVQVQPKASIVGGKLLFNQKLDRDIKMGVELGK